jgi:hypothetical protein
MQELTIPIHHKIYTLRGKQIMLNEDLAELYKVETTKTDKKVMRFIKNA